MLILGLQHLVVLETPKTGSLALRAMLEPYALAVSDAAPRHIGYTGYKLRHAPQLEQAFGGRVETLAVIRAPLERMQSWYRYRMRPKVRALAVSTLGMTFEAFMLAYLAEEKSDFANVGRQDRFVGWTGQGARVDHLFDYGRLDLLEAFLSERLGEELRLPVRNLSPLSPDMDYGLSKALMARYRRENAEEFALFEAVARNGYLRRAGLT